jgi:UDP-N-acetylmuramate-alanine ligase
VHIVRSIDDVVPRLLEITRAGDAVITLGAGSIGAVPRKLMDALKRREAVR